MIETVTIESTIEGWIKSCSNDDQLENMREVVYDKVQSDRSQTYLINLITEKQKSLEGESKA